MITLETPLEAVTFAVVDVETTGLEPALGHRVCEVAVLRGQAGAVLDTWSTLVYPGRSIPADTQQVNHISDAMVRDAPPFALIAPAFLDRLRDTVLVAHNAPFDRSFLQQELRLLGLPAAALPALVVDTCELSRQCYRFASNSLGALGRSLGVRASSPAHRALADVTTTWGVLGWFIADLRRQGRRLDTLADLLALQGGGRGRSRSRGRPAFGTARPAAAAERSESTTTLVTRAIAAGQTLQTRYIAADGTLSERRIAPRRVTLELGTMCVVAYCYLRQEERTFRLDRLEILAVEEVGE
jgi:DNA polymerase III epsilon subunit family exonuclease